jgi:cell wall-associated NlpC family hydrolase
VLPPRAPGLQIEHRLLATRSRFSGDLGLCFCMASVSPYRSLLRALAIAGAIAAALLGSTLTASSAGDLQNQIAAGQSAAASLRSTIATDEAQIRQTSGGLRAAEQRLSALQGELTAREAQLRAVQSSLLAARNHLVELENRLEAASKALAANLVAAYESQQPNLVTVVLDAHGFTDLLEQLNFLQRIGHQDATIVATTRAARIAVAKQADELAALEKRDRVLTDEVLAQRNQVAALQAALLSRRAAEERARSSASARLSGVNARLRSLEAKAAAEAAAAAAAAARAAATQTAPVGGIAVNTGGMVQSPAGAPAAVAQVIAAGNAIATLPYVWGGGHGSFHANGYDCSGSVSYALAAAGLLSSPLDSTGFESWGLPGPGRWITVYANAGHAWMVVAGWRFDTVALAEGGTRWSQSMASTAGFVARHPPGL